MLNISMSISQHLTKISYTFFLLFLVINSMGQQVVWANNLDTIPSYATAITSDYQQSFYTAYSYQGPNLNGKVIKNDRLGNLKWEVNFTGEGDIVKLIFEDSTLYLLGNYRNSFQLDTFQLDANGFGSKRSFIAAISRSGRVNWVSKLPWNENLELAEIKAYQQLIYGVGIRSDINSIIFAMNKSGQVVKSKYLTNNIRVVSDIEFDSMGNLYIAGNASPSGQIDTITIPMSTPASSYLHFLMKLDSSWTAQWVISEPHITFDFNDKVKVVNDTLRYFYQVIDLSNPTNKNIRVDDYTFNGINLVKRQLLRSSDVKYTSLKIHGQEYALFAEQNFLIEPIKLVYYDKGFNKVFSDTLEKVVLSDLLLTGGNNTLLMAFSRTDTVKLNNQLVLAPYLTPFASIASNALISYSLLTGIPTQTFPTIAAFPNPCKEYFRIVSNNKISPTDCHIYSISGQEMVCSIQQESSNALRINVSLLANGVYLVKQSNSKAIRIIVSH